MLKSKPTTKNPLTVIAIFSILTQASASVSLPYINKENQEIYVWFLVAFPIALVILFFITLNFNNKRLYSPSDFSNEENFLESNIHAIQPGKECHDSLPARSKSAPKKITDHPDIRFSFCTPHNLILLPQSQTHAQQPHLTQSTKKTLTEAGKRHKEMDSAKHKTFRRAITEGLHVANLTRSDKHLMNKHELEEVLSLIYETMTSARNSTDKNKVLILLINSHVNALINKHPLPPLIYKKFQLWETTTIFTYNTETDALSTTY